MAPIENFVAFWNKQIEIKKKNRKFGLIIEPKRGKELTPKILKEELTRTNPLARFLPLPDPNRYI